MDEKTKNIINLFYEHGLDEAYANSSRDKYNNLTFEFDRFYDDPSLREHYMGVGMNNKLLYKVSKQLETIENDSIYNKETGNYDKKIVRDMIIVYSLIIGCRNKDEYIICEYFDISGLNEAYDLAFEMLINDNFEPMNLYTEKCSTLQFWDKKEKEMIKTLKKI